ncbi:MAG: DUF1778 domain-containing protein [Pseudomonadota bacterium]|nr:MAG: DUF1778 domain-containing protein [Pseudomonadota bacterium]
MATALNVESSARDAWLDFRLQSEHKRLIEQAAVVSGQSLSEFALSHLVGAAREAVDQATTTRLNRRDRDAFLALISADAEPNEALTAAADQFRRRGA